jgi:hypothetical protein
LPLCDSKTSLIHRSSRRFAALPEDRISDAQPFRGSVFPIIGTFDSAVFCFPAWPTNLHIGPEPTNAKKAVARRNWTKLAAAFKARRTARAEALTGTVLYFQLVLPQFGSKGIARAYIPIPDADLRAFSAAVEARQLDRASAIIQPFLDRQTSAFGRHLLSSSPRKPEGGAPCPWNFQFA